MIDFDATYRDGAIYPAVPLDLPDNTPVHVRIVPKAAGTWPEPFPSKREDVLAIRPMPPRITAEEFDALVEKYGVSVGSLSVDFSRDDIYSDHD